MADRAVVSHIFKLFPVGNTDTAARLLFVKKGFNKQRGGKNLVSRRIQKIGPWRMGGTDGLAFTAAQAVCERISNGTNGTLLKNKALGIHKPERGRVGLAKIAAF